MEDLRLSMLYSVYVYMSVCVCGVTHHITRAVEEYSQTLHDVHVDLVLAAAAFRGQHRDGDIGSGGGLRYSTKGGKQR